MDSDAPIKIYALKDQIAAAEAAADAVVLQAKLDGYRAKAWAVMRQGKQLDAMGVAGHVALLA